MNRRMFLAAAAAAARADDGKPKLLLPTDEPDELGFRIMWYNPVAPLDRATYRLKIGGLVETPQSLDLGRLQRLPQEHQNSRLKCVQCWSARTTWGGFRFGPLLELAKPKKNALAVRLDCADGWYDYMSIQELLDRRVLFTLEMAGKPLTDRHGGPLRLLHPGLYGYKSTKLITALQFVEETKPGMACDLGPYYTPGGEIKSGYDHPLDLGKNERRKIGGGEITEY